ncbi:bifunctional biotin--[acetyl-CoA-carboxylase] ligase/biotin operon repressor BirA [Motiliproteus coralliicola]|uniref:Bifunctional ligase/repressor BirA n=1 Tax=Motiliproteus coralliicola TaxID=2283196 RepID=A0A369WBS8_9GAMM|nr:bifunctional biotin--[acetyl-CoA-carboxylase] ligase/biotin operon repressor BirA [Motiliproteus coralliicola]RDE18164.1 bifunctional biotin--[acetyl-CoA-carboxylase] ligase/biotin operon repressor BirA [Motiliproteus coralliicola]
MALESLLSILADGEFHSGESLGQQLGVSRAAVWKQLKKLDSLGIDCHSVKGRGYRVPGGINLLQIEQLRQGLTPAAQQGLSEIELALSIPSTNRLAMQQAQQQNCHGRLYLAEQQTAGRGRRGRDWASPFGRNLYFSLSWSFSGGAAALEGLSLVVGLALQQGMQALGVDGVELKWPNDLLFRGRKLAGVLLEMSGDASGLCQVVIGVGVNVAMPQTAAQEIDQPWTDLVTIAQRPLDRNAVLAGLLNALIPAMQQFEQQGFAPFREQWQQHNAHRDQLVRLSTESFTVQGRCVGVNESGALLLQSDEGEQAFHGGELSLRSLDDT